LAIRYPAEPPSTGQTKLLGSHALPPTAFKESVMSLLSMRRLFALAAVLALTSAVAWACPFCSAVSQTFTEEINTVNVAVIAKLVQAPPAPKSDAEQPVGALPEVAKSKFEIVEVLKGADALGKTKTIEVLYFGQQPKDTMFLVLGIEPPQISWNAPVPLSDRAVKYVSKLLTVPEKGPDRLAYFQQYLEDPDELLARDAYDEFAKAPYSEVRELKGRMQHDRLVGWIKDKNVLASRRRLYLTMLGVCGTKDDVPMLEELITREEPGGEPKQALDALIACYLTLNGPAGMPLVEDNFLKDEKAEYTDTYSAIMALRFHGQEEDIIPKERLVKALRHMLDRPQMADLVIPDLARWQDWESMDKLVKLFKNADEKSSWVRVPVVQFLKACPLPEAQDKIAELEKIDPESVKRASFFVPLGPGKPMTDSKVAEVAAEKDKSADAATNKQAKDKTADSKKPSDKSADRATVAKPAKTEASGDPLVPPATKTSSNSGSDKSGSDKTADSVATTGPTDSGPTDSGPTQPKSGTPIDAAASQPIVATPIAATANAAGNTATAQVAAPTAAAAPAEAQEENSLWLIFVPLGVGLVLLLVLLVIVRGGSDHVPSEG
jgi:hypothetical protein